MSSSDRAASILYDNTRTSLLAGLTPREYALRQYQSEQAQAHPTGSERLHIAMNPFATDSALSLFDMLFPPEREAKPAIAQSGGACQVGLLDGVLYHKRHPGKREEEEEDDDEFEPIVSHITSDCIPMNKSNIRGEYHGPFKKNLDGKSKDEFFICDDGRIYQKISDRRYKYKGTVQEYTNMSKPIVNPRSRLRNKWDR